MTGKQILHYRILEELGRGGMGVVYKAEDTRLGRIVALKFLSPHLTQDAAAKARFIQEAQAASALEHPNLCTIYSIDEAADGQTFICMAYYEGETLKEKIAASGNGSSSGSRIGVADAVDIATQIAAGLARAHEAGIVHRDIKPANILVTNRGEVKILDFGIAKLAGQAQVTRTGATLGTVAYMSPEQLQGEIVDHRTDIWSLGVVLYEMLAGQVPFRGEIEQATMFAIVSDDPAPVASLNPEVPAALDTVVSQALAKECDERYQQMDEILSDLDARPSRTTSPFARGPSDKTKRARNVIATLAAIVFLAAIGILFFDTNPSDPDQTSQNPESVTPTRIAIYPFKYRGAPEFHYLSEGMVDLLSAKLDGSGGLQTVDAGDILSMVPADSDLSLTTRRADSIAQQFDAEWYILGNILQVGDKLEVTANLYQSPMIRKSTARATINGEAEVVSSINGLSNQLMAEQYVDRFGHLTQLAGVTTQSLPAFKAWIKGEQARRAKLGAGFMAVELFEEAVGHDSTFALAWYRLAEMAHWSWQLRKARIASKKALAMSSQFSERNRKLLQASYWRLIGKADEAERLYTELVGAHRVDADAWYGLGLTHYHFNEIRGRRKIGARSAIERYLELEPGQSLAMAILENIYNEEGEFAKADSLRSIARPDPIRDIQVAARNALLNHNHALWAAQLQAADSYHHGYLLATSNVTASTWLRGYPENPDDALDPGDFFRLMTQTKHPTEWRALGHLFLAHWELARGRWQHAMQELDKVDALAPVLGLQYRPLFYAFPYAQVQTNKLVALREQIQRWDADNEPPSSYGHFYLTAHEAAHPYIRVYLLGLLSAMLNENGKAIQYADELDQMEIEFGAGSLSQDMALSLRAQVALADSQAADALSLLDQRKHEAWAELIWASAFYGQALEIFLKAELMCQTGNARGALDWYDRSASWYNWIHKAPSHLRKAEIYQQLGQYDDAKEHYRRFLRIWENCDPHFQPMVEMAKSQLVESLQAQETH